jgi:hypothetical protein
VIIDYSINYASNVLIYQLAPKLGIRDRLKWSGIKMLEINRIGDLAINHTVKSGTKPADRLQVGNRKNWSIPMDTVLLPYFKATNASGRTDIAHEAIGAPLRVATNTDGSVKFNKAGLPIVKVAKDINDAVKAIRDNLVAGMVEFKDSVVTNPETANAYKTECEVCAKVGAPIQRAEIHKLEIAVAKREAELKAAIAAGIDHAESISSVITQAENIVAGKPETVSTGKATKVKATKVKATNPIDSSTDANQPVLVLA